MLNDCIAAISTALAQGAISIVRLSGEDAIEIANKILKKDISEQAANTIVYTHVFNPDNNQLVDEVLVSVFKAPHSYSGEDMVEINTHGGIFVTKEVLRLLLTNGARLARNGEFSERAYLHSRISLSQAEAVNDMIKANDLNNARLAINALSGSVSRLIEPLEHDLLDIIANIEVNIDYPEYDDFEMLTQTKLIPLCNKWQAQIDEILAKAQSGKVLREGITTAIVGKPNVGKSSLLNALLEEDRAIVSDIEGTTRDTVEGSVRLNNITLNLIDTAGIRHSDDKIEKIGIERSRKAILEAQLVIVLLDAEHPQDELDLQLLELTRDSERIIVYNKKDLAKHDGICISALNNDIQPLIDAINERYPDAEMLEEPMLQNERQIALMIKAQKNMASAIAALKQGYELDLVTIDLQEAYNNLKEINGEVHREDLLDTLFANFCLGK